ncbi:MAG: DUF5666 domain-containing protein [Burkholderiaceae bacterium]
MTSCRIEVAGLLRWLFLAASLFLAGCGESGVGSGGSGYPSGVQEGTVNGFGSVIVDSTVYDDEPAQVSIDLDGEASGELTREDLRLGMQVSLAFEQDGVAQSIQINPQVVGEIESFGASELTVSGQPVTVLARGARATVFAGFSQLSDLGIGERITVFGLFDEFGRLYATRIERNPQGPATLVKVSGVIKLIGVLRRSFRIGQQTFTVDNDTRGDTSPASLRVGDQVAVWANQVGANRFLVRRLDLTEKRAPVGSVRRLIGYVRQAPVEGRAEIGRAVVDVSGASFVNGALSDLVVGRLVVVSGLVQDRELVAEQLRFLDLASDGEIRITGQVARFVSNASFEVRNTEIDASDPSVEYLDGDQAALADGVLVTVRGSIIDGRLRASSIRFGR